MALINDVKEMQMQGMNDMEIIQKLQESGISPLEINRAIEQAKIKQEVQNAGESEAMNNQVGREMQPSVMEQQQEIVSKELTGPEQQGEQYPAEYAYQPYPQQQGYSEYQPYSQTSSEAITEIAEQIAEEKINSLKKSLGNIDELKKIAEKRILDIDERLKKIEKIIDNLHEAIISKMGEYGENIGEIKNEMSMMQDSFSKALNPLLDAANKAEEKHTRHHQPQHHPQHQQHHPQKKQKHAMDNYLRR